MSKQKNYTTENQYWELTELELRENSADMWYHFKGYEEKPDEYGNKVPIYSARAYERQKHDEDLPAWSLNALLNLLPKGYRHDNIRKNIHCDYFLDITTNPESEEWIVRYITKDMDNINHNLEFSEKHLIDAVYKMVKKLLRDGVHL